VTIQEAIRTGKRFRRIGCAGYVNREAFVSFETNFGNFSCVLEDLCLDKWEIEEEKIEITLSQLHKAFEKAIVGSFENDLSRSSFIPPERSLVFKHFCKSLGFKNV
jgi:hypothetical protein